MADSENPCLDIPSPPTSLYGRLANSLVIFPADVLVEKAEDVAQADLNSWAQCVAPFANSMIGVMGHAQGVGLAAPQVGVSKRIFVAMIGGSPMAFANPNIKVPDDASPVGMFEACLSLPGLHAEVSRPDKVVISAWTEKGHVELRLDGMDARVVQHENDHLDGVLFLQRMSSSNQAKLLKQLLSLK